MAQKRLGRIKAREMFSKGLRKCIVCHKVKSLKLFYKNKSRHRGYAYACKECQDAFHKKYREKDYVRKAEGCRAKKYRKKNKKKLLNQRYLKTYGITTNKKLNLLKQQNYCCKVCRNKIDMISGHIDHDHQTKKIRGLLCANCNTALGLFKDSIKLLKHAIKYLGI